MRIIVRVNDKTNMCSPGHINFRLDSLQQLPDTTSRLDRKRRIIATMRTTPKVKRY